MITDQTIDRILADLDEKAEALRLVMETTKAVDGRYKRGERTAYQAAQAIRQGVEAIAREDGYQRESERMRAAAERARTTARQFQGHIDGVDDYIARLTKRRDDMFAVAEDFDSRAAELEAQGR